MFVKQPGYYPKNGNPTADRSLNILIFNNLYDLNGVCYENLANWQLRADWAERLPSAGLGTSPAPARAAQILQVQVCAVQSTQAICT